MIFMVFNFVLENYFEDVLSLVDQSSDICDDICYYLIFFLWIIQIKKTFITYDFGALHRMLKLSSPSFYFLFFLFLEIQK